MRIPRLWRFRKHKIHERRNIPTTKKNIRHVGCQLKNRGDPTANVLTKNKNASSHSTIYTLFRNMETSSAKQKIIACNSIICSKLMHGLNTRSCNASVKRGFDASHIKGLATNTHHNINILGSRQTLHEPIRNKPRK